MKKQTILYSKINDVSRLNRGSTVYGNSSLFDRLQSAIPDPRSSATIWKPALVFQCNN